MSHTTPNTRGVIMLAHNNEEIDYFRMAVVNGFLIQKNLGLKAKQIAVVTDSATLAYAEESLGKKLIKKSIGNIIIEEKDVNFKHSNIRIYKDTSHKSQSLPFYNKGRCDIYDLSPFDETLLIDADYLILSDVLNNVWGHSNEFMMNYSFKDIMTDREFLDLDRLSPSGITMYWATVVYFRKTEFCKYFFDVVKHVRAHKTYYGNLYNWTGNIYRNDYSFSIAAHMLGGFRDRQIPQLPVKYLYKTFDNDDVETVLDDFSLLIYLEKLRSPGDFILTRWKGVDLHVMNKWALNRISGRMLELMGHG